MIPIPIELRKAVQESKNNLVRLIDPETNVEYVVLTAETYEQVRNGTYYDDSPLTEEEQTALLIECGLRAGWNDPEMDVYNDLDPREDTVQRKDPETTPVDRNCNTDPSPTRSIPEEAYSPAKLKKSTDTLDTLLAQVTEDNLPDETNPDPSVKSEV